MGSGIPPHRAAGYENPQALVPAHAPMTKAGEPLPGAVQQLRRICVTKPKPGPNKRHRWFALKDGAAAPRLPIRESQRAGSCIGNSFDQTTRRSSPARPSAPPAP
jgi:hypothetical protein